jgi:protein arginine N-methyltransferase 1
MGYFLLYESMLDTVLFARDKWLKIDGILVPDHAKMYMALLDDSCYEKIKKVINEMI